MSLNADTIKVMRQIAKLEPSQIELMLRELEERDVGEWRKALNSVVLTLWTEHYATRKAVNRIMKVLQEATQGEAAPASAPTNGAGTNGTAQPAGESVMGADGAPITDPAQIEAEKMMNAAAGHRPGTAPPPAGGAPRLRQTAVGAQPVGESRTGADGRPITDPAQLEAERLMDEAAGS